MLLGRLVEAGGAAVALDCFLAELRFMVPWASNDLFFVRSHRRILASRHGPFAATELCPVRCRLLVGEVHDDNAWYAGGVDGHAGLFGTARAVFHLLRFDWRPSIRRRSVTGAGFFESGCLDNILVKMTPSRSFFRLGFDRPAARKRQCWPLFFEPIAWGTWGLPVFLSGWILTMDMTALFC